MTEELKTCTKCGEAKPRTEFYRARRSKDGLKSHCSTCGREASRSYYAAHPKKENERVRRWVRANPQKRRAIVKRSNTASAERKNLWARANPEKRRESLRNSVRRRRRDNPAFRAASLFRTRFWVWLRAKGMKKDHRVLEALGCTPENLITHLEAQFQPGMNWDNWAVDGWHIDHKIPLASAGDDIEAMLKLWHYTNLQPLWAENNLRKGVKPHDRYRRSQSRNHRSRIRNPRR